MVFATIITYYKGNLKYLNKLISSINLSLSKSSELLKHYTIIIDDSENDEVYNNLASFIYSKSKNSLSNIILLKNKKNIGVTKSRLKGLEYISTLNPNYFNIIDQDDYISKDFFNDILSFMKNNEFLIINGKIVNYFKVSSKKIFSRPLGNNSKILLKKSIFYGNIIKTPGLLVFKGSLLYKIIDLYKVLNRKVDGVDDFMLVLYLFFYNFRFIFLDNELFFYRYHNSNQLKYIDSNKKVQEGIKILNNNNYLNEKILNKIKKKYELFYLRRKYKGNKKILLYLRFPVTSIRYFLYKNIVKLR